MQGLAQTIGDKRSILILLTAEKLRDILKS
jgi:hypothetical protein